MSFIVNYLKLQSSGWLTDCPLGHVTGAVGLWVRSPRKCLFSTSLWTFSPCFSDPPNARLLEFYFWIDWSWGDIFSTFFVWMPPNGFNNGLIFEIVFKSAYLRYAAHSWPIGMRFVLVNSWTFLGFMYFSRINIHNLVIAYLIFSGEIDFCYVLLFL